MVVIELIFLTVDSRSQSSCRIDEEQGRKTLHVHWMIWVKDFEKLTQDLFSNSTVCKIQARAKFAESVNKVMSAKYAKYLKVIH